MKENNKVFITMVVLLMLLVFVLIGYITHDLLNNKTTKKDNINQITTNKTNKYFKTDKFDYVLNGKSIEIKFNYYLLKNPEDLTEQEIKNRIENNGMNAYYNSIEVDISVDDNVVKNMNKTIGYDVYNDINKIIEETKFLTLQDTIQVIKGSDSEYIIVSIFDRHPEVDGNYSPFIINENGKVIYSFNFPDNTGWNIEDSNSFMYGKGIYYINNDKLYFTIPNCDTPIDDNEEFPKITIDEYILTISNNNVITEKIGSYKGNIAGGSYCQ